MTLFRFFYQRFHPFYFLILYQMKCLLYLFARYCGKRIMVFHINPPNFIFIQVTFLKRNPTISILLILSFCPFLYIRSQIRVMTAWESLRVRGILQRLPSSIQGAFLPDGVEYKNFLQLPNGLSGRYDGCIRLH